jgi:hypothetical protein
MGALLSSTPLGILPRQLMIIEILNPRPYGSLSENRLCEFEHDFGLELPSDYRAFLLEFNGGSPNPSFFWIVKSSDGSSVHQLYGLHDGPPPYSIQTYAGKERYGIPSGMLKIGDDGVGNSICIGVSESIEGKIYFLDHELHPNNEPESMEGITRLAESFDSFLAILQPSPEDAQDA